MATHRRLVPKDGADFYMLNPIREDTSRSGKRRYWLCVCKCGKSLTVREDHLKSGHTKSCGCLLYKHGASSSAGNHPLYDIWKNMNRRCFNTKNPAYPAYGGRGISVCKEWRTSYEAFRDYMLALPDCPSDAQTPKTTLSREIDRKNNDGNYEPGNVRWSTRSDQSKNRRSTLNVKFRGKNLCLKDYAHNVGIPYHMFQNRLRRGVSLSEILIELTPPVFRFSSTYQGIA